jgi:hypothetical protein
MATGRKRTAALGLLLAAALGLSACGSDDSSSTATQASASTGTQAAATGGDSSSFCDDFAGVSDDIVVNLDGGDMAKMGARMTEAADALKGVTPPAEIADDWNTLVTFYEQFGQAFSNSDMEDDAAMDKVGEAITKLQDNAKNLASASAAIGTNAAKNC